jgi:iron-sulfur cluster repair protein YtfE (RIC family)
MPAMDERPSETWRTEHAVLRHDAARLARLAGDLSDWSAANAAGQLQQVRAFLHGRLLAHAEAEEAVLYPMMDKLLGTEQFTIAMRADHDAISHRTDELTAVIAAVGQGPPTTAQLEALREHLYGLWAIVELHLEKEEQILFDLLDARLSPRDTRTLHEQTQALAPPGLRSLIHTESG